MNLLQWCTASWNIQSMIRVEVKSISLRESVLSLLQQKCQIISFRKNVLCSQITSRSRRARVRSKKTNNVEDIESFRILIDLILWQILVKIEKLEFAFFASMYVRRSLSRIECIIFLIDFSIISHLFHFVDTSSEFSTVKSYRNSTNENAMWNEKSEIFVKSMNHRTNRQCVASSFSSQRQYSDERYLFHDVFFSQV